MTPELAAHRWCVCVDAGDALNRASSDGDDFILSHMGGGGGGRRGTRGATGSAGVGGGHVTDAGGRKHGERVDQKGLDGGADDG